MARLYVDIDDSLIKWISGQPEPHPYGFGADRWEWHWGVIKLLKEHKGPAIIWSGGGEEYARTWLTRLFSQLDMSDCLADPIYAMGKQPVSLQEGDIFVDDSPWDAWKHLNIYPSDL
jgi:hypothetical protein